ncbi:MAG: hypothetical protein ACTSYB_13665 [Candidatus Helarchaeota archaeon]
MTILKGEISEKINQEFRKLAMQRFGYEKGAISKALEEAILKWIIEQRGNSDIEQKERIENNVVYIRERKKLFREYPNKYVTICKGTIAEVGDDFFTTLEKTKTKYPNVKHCLIIKTAKKERQRARLGWRIKRIQKK